MERKHNKEFRLEITQDKLVDILMHAATRDDISNLYEKIIKLEEKVATREDLVATRADLAKLEAATHADLAKLEVATHADFATARADSAKFEAATRADFARLEAKIDKLDAKYDKIVWFILVSIFIPIVLHFLK